MKLKGLDFRTMMIKKKKCLVILKKKRKNEVNLCS